MKPRKSKKSDSRSVFELRIRRELAERLSELASRTGRSRNEVIERWLVALDVVDRMMKKAYAEKGSVSMSGPVGVALFTQAGLLGAGTDAEFNPLEAELMTAIRYNEDAPAE